MKRKYLSALLVFALLFALLPIPAKAASNASQKTQEMAENSAAWHVAKSAYDAAVASGDTAAAAAAKSTMNELHSRNEALAEELAGNGGSVDYDARTGVTTIRTSGGDTITNADGVSNNGSTTKVRYQITDSEGRDGGAAESTQYSDAGIDAYLSAGGSIEELIRSYNWRAKEVAERGEYGDKDSRTSMAEEIAIVKRWYPNLSKGELNTLQDELRAAKKDYELACEDYKHATTDAERKAALAAMQAANEQAEAARARIGYTGNSIIADDGGFFGVNNDMDNLIAASGSGSDSGYTPPHDGTDVVAFTKSYSIVAKAIGGGTISPSGVANVAAGKSKSYSMTPKSGYVLASVEVDGANIGTPTSYTFSNVQSSHTITATFTKKEGSVASGNLVLTDSLGASLYDHTIKSGYGILATLENVSSENVKDIKVVLTYNFGSGTKYVSMRAAGETSYILPVNGASPTGARCIYIPVATKDGRYTLTATVTATDIYTGKKLTATTKGTITVKGNMYEDDFTGNSSRP